MALETVVARIRHSALFYPIALSGYLMLVLGSDRDVLATGIALAIHAALSVFRIAIYRRSDDGRRDADPDHWRRTFAGLATVVMVLWDALMVFELWSRDADATSMLLVTSSLVMRSNGTYAISPDLAMHGVWALWSRVPLLALPILVPTREGLALGFSFVVYMLYAWRLNSNLNVEFWRRVEVTESLERAEVKLRLAQKLESVGRLAGGIAHEINTPLQAIVGSLEFIGDATTELVAMARASTAINSDLDYLEKELPGAIELANHCVVRAATIVRSVQTFAHVDDPSEASELDINATVVTTLAVARHECGDVADVVTKLGDVPRITGYPGELNQALLNIVVNAAHAMAEVRDATGQRGTLTITTSRDRDHVSIAVSDTGNGIPDAIKHRVFDPFFSTKDVGEGTGQGLAIAHAVVAQRHDGELSFESELGRGTTFTIRLPVRTLSSVIRAAA